MQQPFACRVLHGVNLMSCTADARNRRLLRAVLSDLDPNGISLELLLRSGG